MSKKDKPAQDIGKLLLFDDMQKISNSLDCRIGQLVGGYMRQPIHAKQVSDSEYTITAGCVLTGKYNCTRDVPVLSETGVCYNCPVYHRNFPTYTNDNEGKR
jgi:hypothetical protein